jgi:hypothetical protein
MSYRLTAAIHLLLVLLCNAIAARPVSMSASSVRDVLAIINVNVVPMERETILERQTVIIKEGRIAEIGDAVKVRVPAGAIKDATQFEAALPDGFFSQGKHR